MTAHVKTLDDKYAEQFRKELENILIDVPDHDDLTKKQLKRVLFWAETLYRMSLSRYLQEVETK